MTTTAGPLTESLVDAKDEARQAEVRTDIASALLRIETVQRPDQVDRRG